VRLTFLGGLWLAVPFHYDDVRQTKHLGIDVAIALEDNDSFRYFCIKRSFVNALLGDRGAIIVTRAIRHARTYALPVFGAVPHAYRPHLFSPFLPLSTRHLPPLFLLSVENSRLAWHVAAFPKAVSSVLMIIKCASRCFRFILLLRSL